MILNAMPFGMAFVDENDRGRYRSKVGRRTVLIGEETIGGDLRDSHKDESLPKVEKILSDLKTGKTDEAWFWISADQPRILNRFVAIRTSQGSIWAPWSTC